MYMAIAGIIAPWVSQLSVLVQLLWLAHTCPPFFQVELEKDRSRWACFGARMPRTLDYPTINLNAH